MIDKDLSWSEEETLFIYKKTDEDGNVTKYVYRPKILIAPTDKPITITDFINYKDIRKFYIESDNPYELTLGDEIALRKEYKGEPIIFKIVEFNGELYLYNKECISFKL